MAAELCTRLHVPTAVLKPKSRSSLLKAVRSIVELATRNTDVTRQFLVESVSFFFLYFIYFSIGQIAIRNC